MRDIATPGSLKGSGEELRKPYPGSRVADGLPEAAYGRRRLRAARSRDADRRAHAARGAGLAAAGAISGGCGAGGLRDGLLLGRRADLLAGPRGLHDGGRVRRAGTPRTPPTRRSARGAPGTPRRCSSPSTPPRPPTRRCSGCSGRATIPRRGCARATTAAPSTARRSSGTGTPSAARRRTRCAPTSRSSRPMDTDRSQPKWSMDPPPTRSTTPRHYHQQYLAKNPGGYCGLGGTGVACPVGLASAS